MILNKVLGFMCLVIIGATGGAPLPFANNIFDDFLRDGATTESVIVKRTIEDNPDRQLKQISLRSLVEDLEKNIFTSALSLNKVLTDKHVVVPEIKINNESHDDAANRSHMMTTKEDNIEISSTMTAAKSETVISTPKMYTVIWQATEKVPQTRDAPTHLTIDRIAIQPHTSGVAPIPIFGLEQTKNDKGVKNVYADTELVSKTRPTTSAAATTESFSSTSSSSTATTTEDTAVTTPQNIEQLKEAEEELKEKLAEIEAEPVILSARV